MIMLILGILIGIVGFGLYIMSRTNKRVTWYGWLLYVAGAASLILAFDVFTGSRIEHEMQAAWMGLGMFGFIAVVLFVATWRFGIREKNTAEA